MSDKTLDFTLLTETQAYKSLNRMIRTYQAAKIGSACTVIAIAMMLVLSPVWANVTITLAVKSLVIVAMVAGWQRMFSTSRKLTNWAVAWYAGLLVSMALGYFVQKHSGVYGVWYVLVTALPWTVVAARVLNRACDTGK
jgi:hypothetical protein